MKNVINACMASIVLRAFFAIKLNANMIVSPTEASVTEEVIDNTRKSAKLEIIDTLCLDPNDWFVDSLSTEESELGMIHGEGYLNDFMRMHDDMNISASHIDKERQIALDRELLDLYRSYCMQVYYDRKPVKETVSREEYIHIRNGVKHVRRQDAYLGRESKEALKLGIYFAKSIAARELEMDKNCDFASDTMDYVGKNKSVKVPYSIVDAKANINPLLVEEIAADFADDEEEKADYNKVHWNQSELYWDRMITKVESMTDGSKTTLTEVKSYVNDEGDTVVVEREVPNVKLFKKLKGMYSRLWSVQRKRQQINKRQYSELRHMISSYLYSVAKRPENELFWGEKAERDAKNLENTRGSKNIAGENVPDSYFKEIDIDNLMKDEEPRMTGKLAAPNEDQILDAYDRKHIPAHFQITYWMLPDRELREFWNDYLDAQAEKRAPKARYSCPTGAKNVDVADALYELVRIIAHELVHAKASQLDSKTKAACYKTAAGNLEISVSTLRRRIKRGKELLSTLSTPEVAELTSLL